VSTRFKWMTYWFDKSGTKTRETGGRIHSSTPPSSAVPTHCLETTNDNLSALDCQHFASSVQYFAISELNMPIPSSTAPQSCHARSENRGNGVALSDTLVGALTAGVGGYRPLLPPTVTSMNALRSNNQTLVQIMDEALSIMEEDDEEFLRMLTHQCPDNSLPSN
jgi:hypothetical protein